MNLQTVCKLRVLASCGQGANALNSNGEPAGGRTRDHLIKSQVLYRLSYRLSLEAGNLVGDSAMVNEGSRPVPAFF